MDRGTRQLTASADGPGLLIAPEDALLARVVRATRERYGIWAPSATPAHRLDELNDGIGAALGALELRSWLGEHGAEPWLARPAGRCD
jgi:hypothetical protein